MQSGVRSGMVRYVLAWRGAVKINESNSSVERPLLRDNPNIQYIDNNKVTILFAVRYCQLFLNRYYYHGEQRIGKDGRLRYRNAIPGSLDLPRVYYALKGERTYASFGLDRKGQSRWSVIDLDIPRILRKEIEETVDDDLRAKLEKHAWQTIHHMSYQLIGEVRHLGLTPVPIFSGQKGVHLYILLNRPIPVEKCVRLGQLLKWLAQQTEDRNELSGVFDYLAVESYPCESDLNVSLNGGIPHLVKIPLVKHLGSGRFSCFLDPNDLEKRLPNSHLWEIEPDDSKMVFDILESFAGELEEAIAHSRLYPVETEPTNHPAVEPYFRKNIPEGPKKVIERCAAMGQLVKKALNKRHLTHEERLFILFNMIAFGEEGVQAVHDIMKQVSDYDFSKTQYFIDHALRRRYKPYLCDTAQEKGICPLTEACHAVGMYRTPLGVAQGFDAGNRSLIQPVLGELKPDFEPCDLDDVRQELSEKLQAYLRKSPEKALLIQVDAGVGKTTATALALANLPQDLQHYKRIFWAGQRHDMFVEVVKYLPEIKQILPKIGDDADFPLSSPEKKGLCSVEENRYKLRMIREKGWGEIETKKVCLACYIGTKNCEYFQQWNHKGSFFAPQQHLTTQRIQENKINCDVIVIDENPASVFDSEILVTQKDIDILVDFLQAKKFTKYELLVNLLNCLRRTIASYRKLTQGYEVIKDWDDKVRLLYGEDGKQGDMIENKVKRRPENGLHHLMNEINQSRFWVDWLAFIELAEPDDLPKNWLGPLFKAVEQQKLLFDIEHNSRLYVKKQQGEMVLGLLESKKFNIDEIPIICLDATAELHEYKRLIEREFIHIQRRVKMKNPIYQLIDGEYPMQSILPDNDRSRRTRMKLLRFTKAIIERGEKTLVVSTMQFHNIHLVKYLKNARLKKEYVTGYYRNLRGTNEYIDCDQIVLIGVANPNPEELHIKEQARRVNEDYLSNKTTKEFQPYGDGKLMRKTRFYEDERMNDILRQHRENEMIQAVNRIRPLLFPEKNIWILSAIPLSLPSPNCTELDGDELSILLGLKLETRGIADRAHPAYNKLTKAVTKLRWNECRNFTTKKLADTAGVNHSTVKRYTRRLCEDIQYLAITNTGFEIKIDD